MGEPCHAEIYISHVKSMDESCYAYGWVMSRIQMSHVTLMNQSCHAYEWVVSHILENVAPHRTCVSHVTYTYDCVVSHIWTSHATYVNASCHTCESVILHILGNMCDMTHSYVWHDSLCVTWLIHMCDYVWISHLTYTSKYCHTSHA